MGLSLGSGGARGWEYVRLKGIDVICKKNKKYETFFCSEKRYSLISADTNWVFNRGISTFKNVWHHICKFTRIMKTDQPLFLDQTAWFQGQLCLCSTSDYSHCARDALSRVNSRRSRHTAAQNRSCCSSMDVSSALSRRK